MSVSQIMSGLAAISPTYDSDVTIKIWTYDSMFDTLNESDCPVRMIGRFGDNMGVSMEVRNMNNVDYAVWQVPDVLYMFPVPLDKGIENYNHKIWDYMESYLTAAGADPCLGNAGTLRISNVDITANIEPYPNLPGNPEFWVVTALVTVEEYR